LRCAHESDSTARQSRMGSLAGELAGALPSAGERAG
jgi:hypothetical protein